MQRVSRRLFVGGLLGGFAGPALAAAAPAVELTCGIMETPPWYLPDDPKGGIAVETLADLGTHAGIKIKAVPAPIVRQLMAMKAGQLDLMAFFEMPELHGAARSLGALGVLDMGVVTRTGLHLVSAEGLAGLSIGILRGIIRKPIANWLPPSVNLVEIRDLSLGITMIAGGRLDGLIGTPMALGWHLKRAGIRPGAVGSFLLLWQEPLVLYLSTLREYDERTVNSLQSALPHTVKNIARLTDYYWKGAGYERQGSSTTLSPRKSRPPL